MCVFCWVGSSYEPNRLETVRKKESKRMTYFAFSIWKSAFGSKMRMKKMEIRGPDGLVRDSLMMGHDEKRTSFKWLLQLRDWAAETGVCQSKSQLSEWILLNSQVNTRNLMSGQIIVLHSCLLSSLLHTVVWRLFSLSLVFIVACVLWSTAYPFPLRFLSSFFPPQ